MTEHEIAATYANKIFGFARNKTNNIFDAEDLAQEILTAVIKSVRSGRKIHNFDAWINTMCHYTWRNYIVKNKRHWNSSSLDDYNMPDDINTPEDVFISDETAHEIYKETAYLSRACREATVMFYYDGLKVKDIAQKLNLPEGTVKWLLSESRKKIREGIEMAEKNLGFKPIRMWCGCMGKQGPNGEPQSYFKSSLMQNIAYAAYKQPVTIEEIAHQICTAAVFVEEGVNLLVYAGLMNKLSGGRFQTNFVIDSPESRAAEVEYCYKKAPEVAEKYCGEFEKHFNKIKAVGYIGSGLNDNFQKWVFIPYMLSKALFKSGYFEKYSPEERRDGGKYIVSAGLDSDDIPGKKHGTPGKLPADITKKYESRGIKIRDSESFYGWQADTWWSGLNFRDFDVQDVMDMYRVVNIIENNQDADDYDKVIISRLIKKAFVAKKDNQLEILIPVLKKEEFRKLNEIIDDVLNEAGYELFDEVINDFIKLWRNFAPSSVSENELYFKAANHAGGIIFAVLEYLERTGELIKPDDSETTRLSTLMAFL